MPLDGHSYLVSQGWKGKELACVMVLFSRPLAVPQKKNLAGLGKDRDEAFPFWDHLFTAASKAIKVHCSSDEESEGEGFLVCHRGLPLVYFPLVALFTGTPADSGISTPVGDEPVIESTRLSLMAIAKRDAAKRGLYSRFFRGPVLGPTEIAKEEERLATFVSKTFENPRSSVQSISIKEHIEVQTVHEKVVVDLEVSKSSKKKICKEQETDESILKRQHDRESQGEEEEKDFKRRRKEEKRKQKEQRNESTTKKHGDKKKKSHKRRVTANPRDDVSTSQTSEESDNQIDDKKAQRRRRKDEKKRLKALLKKKKDVDIEPVEGPDIKSCSKSHSSGEKVYLNEKNPHNRTTSSQNSEQPAAGKKKRKRDEED